eukprot:363200-Chlamydomonas_euryale.AAC.14
MLKPVNPEHSSGSSTTHVSCTTLSSGAGCPAECVHVRGVHTISKQLLVKLLFSFPRVHFPPGLSETGTATATETGGRKRENGNGQLRWAKTETAFNTCITWLRDLPASLGCVTWLRKSAASLFLRHLAVSLASVTWLRQLAASLAASLGCVSWQRPWLRHLATKLLKPGFDHCIWSWSNPLAQVLSHDDKCMGLPQLLCPAWQPKHGECACPAVDVVKPGVRVARYGHTWGLRRTVHTNTQHVVYTVRAVRAGEALQLPLAVLLVTQHGNCPARCGIHTMDRAPPLPVCATAYERSHVGLFGHEADVHVYKEGFPRPS